MDAIDEFILLYNKQFDYYLELARIGKARLERQLGKRGIKAIVTYRAKRPDSLRDKLRKRIEDKHYSCVEDIFADILDLAGVRVSIYFPSERDLVDEIIDEIFEVHNRNVFPQTSYKPHYNKRFSGYWANHYQVCLREDEEVNKRFINSIFEIQVASVLMHAWSEVEHDLVYKSLSGDISEEELAILDEINGLVMSGEIALERLHKAMSKRTKATKDLGGRYELTNLIVNSLDKSCIERLKLGDTKMLRNYFKTITKMDVDTFSHFLKRVNSSASETISDQLINMIISDYYGDNIEKRTLHEFYDKIMGHGIEGIESFFKVWIILDRGLRIINSEGQNSDAKYKSVHFSALESDSRFYKEEINELKQLYRMRKQLLHGRNVPSEDYIKRILRRLKELTSKVLKVVDDPISKERLMTSLSEV